MTDSQQPASRYTPRCMQCGYPLTHDETAIHRKLLGRASTRFFCITCLAAHFRVSEDLIREKIAECKARGCQLF